MGGDTPKQFLDLAGEPVIIHTVKKFQSSEAVTDILVVCLEEYMGALRELLGAAGIGKLAGLVPGGDTRQASSYNGLKACPEGTELVLIHDSVRPLVSRGLIADVAAAAEETGAAAPVIASSDTIVVEKGGFISDIPDRKTLKRIQTPQGFRFQTMLEAHKDAVSKGVTDSTDDCALVLGQGKPVKAVAGEDTNIKITDRSDHILAQSLMLEARA